jgi:hypothetical protein
MKTPSLAEHDNLLAKHAKQCGAQIGPAPTKEIRCPARSNGAG